MNGANHASPDPTGGFLVCRTSANSLAFDARRSPSDNYDVIIGCYVIYRLEGAMGLDALGCVATIRPGSMADGATRGRSAGQRGRAPDRGAAAPWKTGRRYARPSLRGAPRAISTVATSVPNAANLSSLHGQRLDIRPHHAPICRQSVGLLGECSQKLRLRQHRDVGKWRSQPTHVADLASSPPAMWRVIGRILPCGNWRSRSAGPSSSMISMSD